MSFSVKAVRLASAAVAAAIAIGMVGRVAGAPAIYDLERAVSTNPEDLRACAEYRQLIIASSEYDRAIKLLDRLSSRPNAGPNVFISLALAYVDKVPAASPFKRIFLGRDAMNAASRAIQHEPSLVAYYIRGLVALYYPEAVFHKARGGIADLEHARDMLAGLPAQPYHARVYVSLGDGYWKLKDLARAVASWTDGAGRFPADPALRSRLSTHGADRDWLVERALDPGTRVDTSLRELFAAPPAP